MENSPRPISFRMLGIAIENAWTRLPATVIYIVLFSVWSIIEICSKHHATSDFESGLWYLFTIGMPLTLAVSIWCEYLHNRSPWPQILANILLLADSIYIMCCGFYIDSAWGLSRTALLTALVVAILFVPVMKSWAWNYTLSMLRGLTIAAAFSLVSIIAVALIFITIHALFDLKNFDKAMFSFMVIMGVTLPAIILLHLIPRQEDCEKLESEFRASKFECGTAKYFLLPLTVIYMAILYVYGFNILVAWELPRGGVCWSVTGLTAASFITLFFLEGVRRTYPDDSLAKTARRYLPVALLPLLLLMSVAVIYRINQYGLTLSRLYVLTFNIWSYCTVIYFIIRKPRVVNLIAISFAVVFVATSIMPFANFKTLTDNIIRDRLIQRMGSAGFEKLPVDENQFKKTYTTLPDSVRSDIRSMLIYLDAYKRHSNIENIIITDKDYISEIFWGLEYGIDEGYNSIELSSDNDFVVVPENYTRASKADFSRFDLNVKPDTLAVEIEGTSFYLPFDSLKHIGINDHFEGLSIYPLSGNTDSVYVTNNITLYYLTESPETTDDICRLFSSGILFIK